MCGLGQQQTLEAETLEAEKSTLQLTTSSIGGSIHLKSGLSESTSSGDIVIESPDVTPLSSLGPSGSITMSTGHANKASGSCKYFDRPLFESRVCS